MKLILQVFEGLVDDDSYMTQFLQHDIEYLYFEKITFKQMVDNISLALFLFRELIIV